MEPNEVVPRCYDVGECLQKSNNYIDDMLAAQQPNFSSVTDDASFVRRAGQVTAKLTQAVTMDKPFNLCDFALNLYNHLAGTDIESGDQYSYDVEFDKLGDEFGEIVHFISTGHHEQQMYVLYNGKEKKQREPKKAKVAAPREEERPVDAPRRVVARQKGNEQEERIRNSDSSDDENEKEAKAMEGETDETVWEIDQVRKKLGKLYVEKEQRPVRFIELVCDPESYGKTVENTFYANFLVKEGSMRLFKNRSGVGMAEPCAPPKDAIDVDNAHANIVNNIQVITTLDFATWKLWCEELQPAA